MMNTSKIITDAISLVLRADSKFLTGDWAACRNLLAEARQMTSRISAIHSRQVHALNEEILRLESLSAGQSEFILNEKYAPYTPDLLVMTRALIAAGNLESARKELERLIRIQPDYCSNNPEITLLRKLLSAESDINQSQD
jgi:hypothetical protein